MRRTHPETVRRPLAAFLLLSLAAAAGAHGQVVANPNQIVGTIEFTNTNPYILDVLRRPPGGNQGFQRVHITANSVDVSPQLNTLRDFTAAGGTSTPYEITVEAGPPGSGIRYNVGVKMFLDVGDDRYYFDAVTSAPVVEEPAADVVVDVRECAGLLDIRWQTEAGTPVTVDGGLIGAYRESSPGSGSFALQAADDSVPAGSGQRYLAVRGDGSLYRIDLFFNLGTNPYSNTLRFLHQTFVEVGCDQVVEIVCPVPEGGPGGQLGKIVGELDMLGEVENRVLELSLMRAVSGPLSNYRLDTVDNIPSQGSFDLENLVPSDYVTPAVGYRVFGDLSFRSGHRHEYFRTPMLGDENGRVSVSPGETVDLGDTFVIDPGFVAGEIFLAGPPPGAFGSCVQDLFRDSALRSNRLLLNNRFRFDASYIVAHGRNTPAAGATKSAAGGLAEALFEGEFNPDPQVYAFEGDYDIALGGLLRETSVWRGPYLNLHFRDLATPDVAGSYQSSWLGIIDHDAPVHEIVPGQTIDAPLRYCFGQLNLSFVSTATDFFSPYIIGSGSFSGPDFESSPATYTVNLSLAWGTPNTRATAALQGQVVACLPEGTYDLTPHVFSVNPGGGSSRTELPPVLGIDVGCRQVKDVTPPLEVSLETLPACTGEPMPTLSGSAESIDGVPVSVDEIFATVNGGPAIPVCTDCGEDPTFTVDVPLAECDNEIAVTAEAPFEVVSSTTASIRFDGSGPLFAGCDDVAVDDDPGQAGAVVDFTVTAGDDCDGSRPVVCDPPSGSFFDQGSTEVTCTAADTCENEASCSFTVSVCQPVEPDVRTQGFWKRQCQGPHPSGEHDNLPSYVDRVNANATFADVADVQALCDRLDPRPRNDKCEQAEAQMMAAALNLASGRLAGCNCLDDPDLGATTAGEATSFVDGLLADPSRTFDDCVLAQAIADRINNGETLVDCQ